MKERSQKSSQVSKLIDKPRQHALKMLLQKIYQTEDQMHVVFIDLKKTYDFVLRTIKHLFPLLKETDLSPVLINAIFNLHYDNSINKNVIDFVKLPSIRVVNHLVWFVTLFIKEFGQSTWELE